MNPKEFFRRKDLKPLPVTNRKMHRIRFPKDLLQSFSKHFRSFSNNSRRTNRPYAPHSSPHEMLPHTRELSALCARGMFVLMKCSFLAESEKATFSKHSMPTYSLTIKQPTPTQHQNSYHPQEYPIRNEFSLQQNRCRLFFMCIQFLLRLL